MLLELWDFTLQMPSVKTSDKLSVYAKASVENT